MTNRLRTLLVGFGCCLGLMGVVVPAAAQETPAFEVSGGYSFLNDFTDDISLPVGWYASVSGNVNDWFGIVGDIGANYTTETVLGIDIDLTVTSFLFGPKFSGRPNERITVFFQSLVGAARLKGSAAAGGVSVTATSTDLALQEGGGIDIKVAESVSIRVGGDYRIIISDTTGVSNSNEFRLTTGVVYGFGAR